MKTNIYDIDKNESRMDRNNYHVYYIATHSKLTIDQIANYLGRSNASIVLDLLPYICNGYFESVEHLAPNFNIITKYCSDFEIVAGLIGVIPVFQTSQQYYESKRKEIIKDIGFHNGIRVSIAEMTVCCYFSVSRKQDRETIFKMKKQLVERFSDFFFDKEKELRNLDLMIEEDYYTKDALKTKNDYNYSESRWHDNTWDAMTNGEYEDYMGCDNFDWMR